MLKKRLELGFIFTIFIAVLVLVYNFYSSYTFKNSPLSKHHLAQITQKESDVLAHMQKNFGFTHKFPIIITDKIPGRLYGLTSYKNADITIYLNKKVMQESFEYILESVIAHEYAHALMFKLGRDTNENAGHSKEWQKTCQLLGGKGCQKYVNSHEVIMSKMPFK